MKNEPSADETYGRSLPGEDIDTVYPHDAEHWVRVYTELIRFLDVTTADGLEPDLKPPLRGRRAQMAARLKVWEERRRALAGPETD